MPEKDKAYYDSLADHPELRGGPSMYSTEGDDAVRAAVIQIETMAAHEPFVRNRATLTKAASPILRAVAEIHPEIWDTEPRAWIGDKLDAICEANGWAYEEWEAYEW